MAAEKEYKAALTEKIDTLRKNIKTFLAEVDTLPEDEAREILQRYAAAFKGNFTSWIGGGIIAARSPEAQHAMKENLTVELAEDHPSMLHDFAAQANALPDAEHLRAVDKEVRDINRIVGQTSGLKTTALAAILESTSLEFVPYLEKLGKKLGVTDFTYTQKHGEADIAHAEQFQNAFEDEACWEKRVNAAHGISMNPTGILDEVTEATGKLLEKIFRRRETREIKNR